MSRGAAGKKWEALKTNGNFCDMTRHEIAQNVLQFVRWSFVLSRYFLAGDAVGFEPVSTRIPCKQGILQGTLRFCGSESRFRGKKSLCRSDLSQNSLRELAGIFFQRTGNFSNETGNLQRRRRVSGPGRCTLVPNTAFPDHCCFSQNESRPCEAEPPITQGMPTATWPSAAAETQPSATAPTPTWPQKSRLRLLSEPLALNSSTAASASLRTAPSCTVSAAWITSASGALIAAGCCASSLRRNSRKPASRTA